MKRNLSYWKGRLIDAESVVDDLQMLNDHPEYYAIMCKAVFYASRMTRQIEAKLLERKMMTKIKIVEVSIGDLNENSFLLYEALHRCYACEFDQDGYWKDVWENAQSLLNKLDGGNR